MELTDEIDKIDTQIHVNIDIHIIWYLLIFWTFIPTSNRRHLVCILI